jgi:cytochrome c peroxidase
MASVARTFARRSLFINAARPQTFSTLRQGTRRGYSSSPGGAKSGGGAGIYAGLAVAVGAGGVGYYLYSNGHLGTLSGKYARPTLFTPTKEDYQKVYDDVADILEDNDYDDGSYGPVCCLPLPKPFSFLGVLPFLQTSKVVLRLGWHASGTYDAETKTGGSNGATMRFAPESDHGANAGLKTARDLLEQVKQKHPWISYSDLWILSAICAVQEMGGPKIPFRPGRTDRDVSACTPGMISVFVFQY